MVDGPNKLTTSERLPRCVLIDMAIPGGTYDWKKITKRCVVPVRHCRADGQTLVIFIYSKTIGSIWIDDITLTPIEQLSSEPPIQ